MVFKNITFAMICNSMNDLRKINYMIAVVVVILGVVAVYNVTTRQTYTPLTSDQLLTENTAKIVQSIDNWDILCFQNDSSRKSNKDCYAQYRLLDDSNQNLFVQLKMIDRNDVPTPRLKVIAPFGVFLPAGITLTLPMQDEFTVPLQFCEGQGCYINLDLSEEITMLLSQSKQLRVSYLLSSRETVTKNVALSGFARALNQINRPH